MKNHWLNSNLPSLNIRDIDTSTKEGRWLLAAVAKLSTESQTDKHPDEILQQVDKLSMQMFDDPTPKSIAPKQALETLEKAFQDDYGYAWSWHCNIACCALDEGVDHAVANAIADRFMQLAFHVDTSKEPS